MFVFHAAKLANSQALASGLQRLVASNFTLAGFAALGGGLVRGGDGAVFGDVFLGFFIGLRCYRISSCLRNEYEG